MFEEWIETVEMIVRCKYDADLQQLIEEGRVRQLQMLYEGGVDENQAADAIAEVCWL
jgi:hypothetical protein